VKNNVTPTANQTEPESARRPQTPLVTKLVALLHEDVARLASGERLPSEIALAAKYTVARKSIRAALDALAKQGIVQRIQGRGTFPTQGRQANALSRALPRRFGIVNWFSFFHQGDEKGFYARLLEGVLEEAFEHNIEIVLAGGKTKTEKAEACYRLSEEARLDGIILIAVTDKGLLDALASRNKPLCLVDHYTERSDIDSVYVNSKRATELAVEHLYHLGHRRIAYTQPERTELNPQRLEGFKDGMTAHGLEIVPDLLAEVPVTFSGGAQAVSRLLNLPVQQRPTALVAFSPEVANGAIQAIQEFGLRVPEDISVAAGAGLQHDDSLAPSRLTEAVFDTARLGHVAIQCLCRRVDVPGHDIEEIVLPVELNIGRSTARRKQD
jgi:LacI family repressor for deo operon, udp, cdd, tsx, nupC, and nupG